MLVDANFFGEALLKCFGDVRTRTPRFEINQSEAFRFMAIAAARFTRRRLASKESSKGCNRKFRFR